MCARNLTYTNGNRPQQTTAQDACVPHQGARWMLTRVTVVCAPDRDTRTLIRREAPMRHGFMPRDVRVAACALPPPTQTPVAPCVTVYLGTASR
eukprot:5549422-Prymnesium_polylepis.2